MVARRRSAGAALLNRTLAEDVMSRHRVALLALALAVAGCATNPVTGAHQFSLVSSAQEEQIGREGFPAVVAEYGAYGDPALQAYVDTVGHRVARVSHLPNLAWKFTLLDDPTVNAFAMPGGYIYVTRGILAHLNSEAQLAGVLGHEIGHVTARHTANRMTQQQLAGLGLGIASAFSPSLARYSDVAQQGLGLMFLKYSRDDETQADELGVTYATAAGYDPREIPSTYAMLKRVSDRAGQRLPGYLSTHPDPGNREERTRGLAQKAVVGKTGLVVRGRAYVQKMDGVVFGTDPRQGFLESNRYYHPQLRFQMSFPEGWKVQDSRTAVRAVLGEDQPTAQMELTLMQKNDFTPEQAVAELERTGRISGARGSSETIGGFPAWVGHVAVPGDQGAVSTLTAVLVRRSPELMFEVVGKSGEPGDAADEQILAAARSFRELTDPARLAVQPDRVKVVAAQDAMDFQGLVQSLGAQAANEEDTEILNNAHGDQMVNANELVKIVVAGRKR
jgi:predicted Zn-dependent protease